MTAPRVLLPRRRLVGAGLMLALALRPVAAQNPARSAVQDAVLDPELRAAIRRWAGDTLPLKGRVTLDVAPLVENGNAVPVTVRVASPMTVAEHVREIALLNERNPLRELVSFSFTPASGRAEASARVRLATTQHLVALARMSDGSVWQHTVEVIVTLAACLE